MTAKKPRRVSLRVEAAPGSVEAKLLNYVKEDPITPSRAVTLRALKAFYLPWALEGEVSEADLKNLAQSAIEELQFRMFQIRQRYLTDEGPAYRATPAPRSATNGSNVPPSPQPDVSLSELRQSINPDSLDDF